MQETYLGLIAVGALAAFITSVWALVLSFTRKPEVGFDELHQTITATRLELSDLTEKFISQQRRNAVRAMRERKAEEAEAQEPLTTDPGEVKRRLRQQHFGGTL